MLPGRPSEDRVPQGQRHPSLQGRIHGVSSEGLPGSPEFRKLVMRHGTGILMLRSFNFELSIFN